MSSYLRSSTTTQQKHVYNRPNVLSGGGLSRTHVYATSLNQPKVHVRGLKPSILRKPPSQYDPDGFKTYQSNTSGSQVNTYTSNGDGVGSIDSLNSYSGNRRSSSVSTINAANAHTHTPQSMGTLSNSSSRNNTPRNTASRNNTPSSSHTRVNYLNKTPSQKAAEAQKQLRSQSVANVSDHVDVGTSTCAHRNTVHTTMSKYTSLDNTSTHTRGAVHVPSAVIEEPTQHTAQSEEAGKTADKISYKTTTDNTLHHTNKFREYKTQPHKHESTDTRKATCDTSCDKQSHGESTSIARKSSTDESAIYPTPHNSTSPKIVKSTELASEHTHTYACTRTNEHVYVHTGSDTCIETLKKNSNINLGGSVGSVSPTLHDRVRERGGFGYHIGGVYAPKLRPNLSKLALSYNGRTDTCVNEISDNDDDYTSNDGCDMSFGRVTEKAVSAVVEIVRRDWDGQNQYTRTNLCIFLRSLCVRMNLDTQCLISTLVYLHRLKMKYPSSRSASCARRVLFMSLLAATKFNHDRPYDNKAWAMVSNFSLHQVNAMELQFLNSLDYVLSIRGKDVDDMLQGLRCPELVLKIDHQLDQSERASELEKITARLGAAAVLPDLSDESKLWLKSSVLTVQNIIEGVSQ